MRCMILIAIILVQITLSSCSQQVNTSTHVNQAVMNPGANINLTDLGPFSVSCSEYAQAVLGESQGRLLQ